MDQIYLLCTLKNNSNVSNRYFNKVLLLQSLHVFLLLNSISFMKSSTATLKLILFYLDKSNTSKINIFNETDDDFEDDDDEP